MEHFKKIKSGLYVCLTNINYSVKKVPNVKKYEIIKNDKVLYTRSTLASAMVNCYYEALTEEIAYWDKKLAENH